MWHVPTVRSTTLLHIHDAYGSRNKLVIPWCNVRRILLPHEARDRNSVSCQVTFSVTAFRYAVTLQVFINLHPTQQPFDPCNCLQTPLQSPRQHQTFRGFKHHWSEEKYIVFQEAIVRASPILSYPTTFINFAIDLAVVWGADSSLQQHRCVNHKCRWWMFIWLWRNISSLGCNCLIYDRCFESCPGLILYQTHSSPISCT
jgi:hypothetical protein